MLKLANQALKCVTEVKFLGVFIDENISWEPQIDYLKQKLISSIVVIKQIKKFVPKTEYLKIYNTLFKSHLSYCISCWGGISQYKLQKLFSLQKHCISILLGKEIGYDRPQFYDSCARVGPYKEHIAEKTLSWKLEHKKPIFNEKSLVTLHHLYIYHTFCEIFKLLKYRIPMPIFQLFNNSSSEINLQLIAPKTKLDMAKKNFVLQATCIWNSLNKKVFNQCLLLNKDGVAIPGSKFGSDITTPVLPYLSLKKG